MSADRAATDSGPALFHAIGQAVVSDSGETYRKILLPVDSSKHSDEAVQVAARWAERLGSTVTGFHVYAARLHETRFQQMESGLPARYQVEDELERQRDVHNTLISDGLRIISESYLDHAQAVCEKRDVVFERRLAEGKHYVEILHEADSDGHDLVAMGALGLGAKRRSLIGGVTERVMRRCARDVLVVRRPPPESQGVTVAIDGSPNSLKAVEVALRIAEVLEEPVEVVSVFDPRFHIAAFKSISKVLSEEAGRVFRFDEQQKLHAEIIDKGLEKLYRGHLQTAAGLAEDAGHPVNTTLLAGKPFQSVGEHVRRTKPSLLVLGRFGMHRAPDADIGNTCENLARLVRCSVLIVAGELTPEARGRADSEAETDSLAWTAEAEASLENVPAFARGMARAGIEDYARQHGFVEVTPEIMSEARGEMGM